jgi:hypothetical protein
MTLHELYNKWFTKECITNGKTVDALGNTHTIPMDSAEHNAPLGDFLKSYIDHISIPWWRKSWDWKVVERMMRDHLNTFTVRFYGRQMSEDK